MDAAMLGSAKLSIRVIRADGTIEDYGEVSRMEPPKEKEEDG